MKALKVVALILVFIILLMTSYINLVSIGVDRTMLSSSFYSLILTEDDLIEQVHEEFQDEIYQQLHRQMKAEAMADLPDDLPQQKKEEVKEEIEGNIDKPVSIIVNSFARAFDTEWLANQSQLLVDDILFWIKGEQDELTATLDLKTEIQGLKHYLVEEFEKLSDEELEKLNLSPEKIEPAVAEFVNDIDTPDKIYLQDIKEDKMPYEIKEIRSYIQSYRGLALIIPFIVLALSLVACCFFS